MSRDERVAHIYGYAVCLVAVVTVLISVPQIVQNLFTLASPLAAERAFDRSLASFEAYKATGERGPVPAPEGKGHTPPPDSVLRREYETVRGERLAGARFQATRSLVSSGLLLGLAVALFCAHWRWLRRRESV